MQRVSESYYSPRSGYSADALKASIALQAPEKHSVIDDLGFIMATVGDDLHFLEELVAIFRRDMEGQAQELLEAIESRNQGSGLRAAHCLRGSVSNFSCSRCAKKAFLIEEALNQEHWPVVREEFIELCQLLDTLMEELNAIVATEA